MGLNRVFEMEVPAKVKGTWAKQIEAAQKKLLKEFSAKIDEVYGCAAIVLKENYKWKPETIQTLFRNSLKQWHGVGMSEYCAIETLVNKTGLELQNGNGESYETLKTMNSELHRELEENGVTPQQMIYIKGRERRWCAATVMALMLLTLHEEYGWGARVRLQRFMFEVDDKRTELCNNLKLICTEVEKVTGKKLQWLTEEVDQKGNRICA